MAANKSERLCRYDSRKDPTTGRTGSCRHTNRRQKDRSLYTGITTDVQRRFSEHLSGDRKAAKYTKSFFSLELAYEVPIGGRSLAAKIEYRIKRLPRLKKEFIISKRLSKTELIRFIEREKTDSRGCRNG